MRVMVVVKATAQSEAGVMPDPSMFIEMGKFNDELIAAGIMLDGAGLKASSNGRRLTFRGRKATVTDGPFAEPKELIAGYWIWEVKDVAQAIEWASRAPMQDGDTLEVRPFMEPEDFAGVVPDAMIEQEKGWRDGLASKAHKAG